MVICFNGNIYWPMLNPRKYLFIDIFVFILHMRYNCWSMMKIIYVIGTIEYLERIMTPWMIYLMYNAMNVAMWSNKHILFGTKDLMLLETVGVCQNKQCYHVIAWHQLPKLVRAWKITKVQWVWVIIWAKSPQHSSPGIPPCCCNKQQSNMQIQTKSNINNTTQTMESN